jgi:hypothetical protein
VPGFLKVRHEITEIPPFLNPKPDRKGGKQLFRKGKGRETVLQGSFKASLRERFLMNRNGRAATCLSPEGEFVAEQ